MISVVIPVHNVEIYLQRCIDSVLTNTIKDLEIILVENGSDDDSLKICKEYESKFSNVRLLVSEITGASHARNMGLEAAKGEWITFVDADDYVSPYMYEVMLTAAKSKDADIVYCDYLMGEDEAYQFSTRVDTEGIEVSKKHFFEEIYLNSTMLGSAIWNKLYSADLLEDVRFDEELPYVEDRLFSVTAACKSNKIVFINEIMYLYYRGNKSSISLYSKSRDAMLNKKMYQLYGLKKELQYLTQFAPDKSIYWEYNNVCMLQNCDLRLRQAKKFGRVDQVEKIKPLQKAALKALKSSKYIEKKTKLRLLWEHYDYRSFYLVYSIFRRLGLK